MHSRYSWKFKARKTTVNNTSLSALQQINSCLSVQKPGLKQIRVMLDGVTPAQVHTLHIAQVAAGEGGGEMVASATETFQGLKVFRYESPVTMSSLLHLPRSELSYLEPSALYWGKITAPH